MPSSRDRFPPPANEPPTPEELSFALTAVDNRGADTSDTVVIRVEPQVSLADTRAPSTHYQRKRTRVDGHRDPHPDDPASVHFRVKGHEREGARPNADWQLQRSLHGAANAPRRAHVMFYAVDAVGNVESIKRSILRRRE